MRRDWRPPLEGPPLATSEYGPQQMAQTALCRIVQECATNAAPAKRTEDKIIALCNNLHVRSSLWAPAYQ